MSEQHGTSAEAAKAVVRRNTKRCRVAGTSTSSRNSSPTTSLIIRPSRTPLLIKTASGCFTTPSGASPDLHPEIHWQAADGEIVTTYKTYHGTHHGTFLGVAPTGRTGSGRILHFAAAVSNYDTLNRLNTMYPTV